MPDPGNAYPPELSPYSCTQQRAETNIKIYKPLLIYVTSYMQMLNMKCCTWTVFPLLFRCRRHIHHRRPFPSRSFASVPLFLYSCEFVVFCLFQRCECVRLAYVNRIKHENDGEILTYSVALRFVFERQKCSWVWWARARRRREVEKTDLRIENLLVVGLYRRHGYSPCVFSSSFGVRECSELLLNDFLHTAYGVLIPCAL